MIKTFKIKLCMFFMSPETVPCLVKEFQSVPAAWTAEHPGLGHPFKPAATQE